MDQQETEMSRSRSRSVEKKKDLKKLKKGPPSVKDKYLAQKKEDSYKYDQLMSNKLQNSNVSRILQLLEDGQPQIETKSEKKQANDSFNLTGYQYYDVEWSNTFELNYKDTVFPVTRLAWSQKQVQAKKTNQLVVYRTIRLGAVNSTSYISTKNDQPATFSEWIWYIEWDYTIDDTCKLRPYWQNKDSRRKLWKIYDDAINSVDILKLFVE